MFIAWLEEDPQYDLVALEHTFWAFTDGRLRLATSSITRIEVMRNRNSPDAYRKFRAMMGNPRFDFVPADNRVIDEAHEIRNWLLVRRDEIRAKGPGGTKITTSTPDSIHLASAGRANCEEFLTYDGKDPLEHIDRKLLPLGSLNYGPYNIPIIEPQRDPEPEPPTLTTAQRYGQDSLFESEEMQEHPAPEEDDPDEEPTNPD